MRRILLILTSIVAAAVAFAVLRGFDVAPLVSLGIAVIFAIVTAIAGLLDLAKKPLEMSKLYRENQKLKREAEKDKQAEEEKKNLVHQPTPEEIKEFGTSYLERDIRLRLRRARESERLNPRPFISDSREDRR